MKVSLFELAERVLPNETPMASQAVTTALEGAGVDVYVGEGVQEIRGQGTVVCGGAEFTVNACWWRWGASPTPRPKS